MYKTIAKQIGLIYGIKAWDAALAFLLFVFLSRFLTIEEFGVYSIINISIFFLAGLLSLAMQEFIVKDIAGKSNKYMKLKTGNILKFAFMVVLISLILLSFLKGTYLSAMGITFSLAWQFSLFIIGINVLSGLLYWGYMRAKKQMVTASIYELLFKSAWILPILIIAPLGVLTINNIFGIRLAIAFALFVVLIVHLSREGISIQQKVDWKYIKRALAFSLPLVTLMISNWVITASDRYFLAFFHDAIAVGYYSYVYSLLNFIGVLGIIAGLVVYPYMAEAWNTGKKKKSNFLFNASLKYALILTIPSLVGVFILRNEIISMLSGVKYLEATSLIPILLIFPLIEVIILVFQKPLLLANRTKEIASIFGIGMILNALLNLFLIPRWSMHGAAFATMITYVVMFFAFLVLVKKYCSFNFEFLKIERMIVSTVIMGAFIFFITPENIFTKIVTILFGAIIYTVMVFASGVFVKEEEELLHSLFKIPSFSKSNK